LAEPVHDEFLGVEPHRLAWTTLSQAGVIQHGDSLWIEAEEVEPPAVRPITFQAIKESAAAIVQQTLTKVLAIATQDQVLTSKGNL
jgi:hypothetical protein